MRTPALIFTILVLGVLCTTAGSAGASQSCSGGDIHDRAGLVFRCYALYGYRFQPLLSLGALDGAVSRGDRRAVRRLAHALLARGVRRGGALYWQYDFPYGGPVPWTSGFAQAVAAQALARAGVLLDDSSLRSAADASFRAMRDTLLMPLGGGSWIREYGFTHQAILNAQLESLLAIESYADVVKTPAARHVAASLEVAARTLLPRFDMGSWGRYELGGAPATRHYEEYHVDLLRRVAETHREPIWRNTYLRWLRGLS
jgi:hypothetical protein